MRGEHLPLRQTDPDVYRAAMRLARLAPGERYLEVGCGEGHGLVIAANEFGADAIGVELRPDVAKRARKLVRRSKARAQVVTASIFDYDVSGADVVHSYTGPAFQDQLADQLAEALAPTARVVTIDFSMPGWRCTGEAEHGGTNCFAYTPAAPWCGASIEHPVQAVLMSVDDPMDAFTVVKAHFHRDFDRIEVELDGSLHGVVAAHHRAGPVHRGVTVPIDMELVHQSQLPPTGRSGFATIVGVRGTERVACARQRWIVLPFRPEPGEDALLTMPGDAALSPELLDAVERAVGGSITPREVAAVMRRDQ